jgi:oligopeptide transport system permease protein
VKHILQRLAIIPPLLLAISFLAFALVRLAPGGPFDRERKPASPEIERALLARYHLDESIPRQYLRFLAGLAHGDLGASLKYRNHTVADIVVQGLPVSLTLGLCAFLFALGLGLPAGFYGALRRGRWADHGTSFLILLAVCVPGFVVGPVLVMLFAIRWPIFPVALWQSPLHVILPTVSLGIFFAGKVARMLREGMTRTLHLDFVRTARAKGLPEPVVLLKHAFPLAVMPVVSYAGPMLADLLTGSFVIENLFQIPGIGVFMVNSSLNRDYPMVVGLVLLYAALLLVLNLVVDLAYTALDPRVRHA